MQSININVCRKGNSFQLPILMEKGSLNVKFDTGASKTIISAEVIFGELNAKQRALMNKFCSERSAFETFTSASGHKIFAYPVHMKDVIVGNEYFDCFYYYLIVDELHDSKKIALLGDNFIDCCGLKKEPHGNFIITTFDSDNYCIQANSISTDELSAII